MTKTFVFDILNFGSAFGGLFICYLWFVIWNLIYGLHRLDKSLKSGLHLSVGVYPGVVLIRLNDHPGLAGQSGQLFLQAIHTHGIRLAGTVGMHDKAGQ